MKLGAGRIVLGLLLLGSYAQAAQFQLGVLIRNGFAATGAGNWEFGAGDSGSSLTSTGDLGTNWANNVDRLFEIQYQKATNNLQVRIYQDGTNTSAFSQINFNPTGGAAVGSAATWTISAASFFVTAASGPNPPTSITLSNIALSGLSGAINILQPFQQTTLTASRSAGGPTSTVTQSQDIVFQGDATGSWQLSGILNLKGLSGSGVTGNSLAFGFDAGAVGFDASTVVPEASSLALVGVGMTALGLLFRRRRVNR